jgi:hypothetical protein
MISNHSTIVEVLRPAADALSAKVAQYLAAGGRITLGESPAMNPLPPTRTEKIDPGTVLKRRPKAMTRAERLALRKMADSL